MELKELEARVELMTHLRTVLNEIERKKRLAAYRQCIDDTSTQTITRKSTELTKELVTDQLRSAFQKELAQLQFDHLAIEVQAAGGVRGALFHRLAFTKAPGLNVTGVLSEGESRALSLAAFLTELTTATTQSAIIFDDPVSSLDHIRVRCQGAETVYRNAGSELYEADAREIYGLLREAWEQAVSEVLLNDVVERYRPSIETQKVRFLYDISESDCKAVEEGMTECSRWIRGHDHLAADGSPFPPPTELKRRIEDLNAFVRTIRSRRQ